MKEPKTVRITVYRDSHGHFWMLEEDIMKLAPNLERDYSQEIEVTV